MIVEGGIRAIRGDHRIARSHKEPNKISQQSVDPFAHHDIFDVRLQVAGKGRTQIEVFGVAIHPLGCFSHRPNCAGRGAKDVFIGAEACVKALPQCAFLRFGADEGNGGGERAGEFREAEFSHEA